VNCPDCQGELELQESGEVVRDRAGLTWRYGHTDAVCSECEGVFIIEPNGRIRRNDAMTPLDEVFR